MDPVAPTSLVTSSERLDDGYGTVYVMRAGTEEFTVTLTSRFYMDQQWLEHTLESASNELGADERMMIGIAVQRNGNSNAAATLQLCVGHNVLMIQLALMQSDPTTLRTLLTTNLSYFVCLDRQEEIAANLMACRHALELRSRFIYLRDYFRAQHNNDDLPVIMERQMEIQGYVLLNQPNGWMLLSSLVNKSRRQWLVCLWFLLLLAV